MAVINIIVELWTQFWRLGHSKQFYTTVDITDSEFQEINRINVITRLAKKSFRGGLIG